MKPQTAAREVHIDDVRRNGTNYETYQMGFGVRSPEHVNVIFSNIYCHNSPEIAIVVIIHARLPASVG